MQTLYEDDWLRLRLIDRPGPTTTVCFTGIGHAMGGIDVQREEFVRSAGAAGPTLFVTDKQRSWGNHLNFPKLVEQLAAWTRQRRVVTIGNSMGGFLAALSGNFFEVDVAIAFAAQFSVDKRIVPEEHRWDQYVDDIEEFHYPSLTPFLNRTTHYYFFSGDAAAERRHWSQLPEQSNLHNIVVREIGHDVGKAFKEAGILYDVIDACRNGVDPRAIIHPRFSTLA